MFKQRIYDIFGAGKKEEARIIAHIDMNSYFATVEQQANPRLRGKPIGVSGKNDIRSIVAAASVEAKKRGVKTAMSIPLARRICPEIIIIPGDPTKYEEVTKRFIRIFIDYTPEVEIFSVDEAFLDFSHLLKSENSKPQHQKSWCRGKQKTVNSYKEVLKIAFEIKKRIHDEVGEWITCSVGIGPNKMIAKLASDKIKPDGLVIVRPQEVKRFMKTVKLTDICGIASRIERRLNMLGIKTPAQIDDFSEKILVLEFGVYGRLLKLWGSGEDPTPLVPYYQDSSPKSVGHSYTLPKDTYDQREVNQYLYLLSDKVGRRARRLGYAGKTLSLYLRFADFSCWYKVKKFEFAISDSYQIYKSALFIMRCLERMKAVRMVGISLSSLIETKHTIYPLMPPERKVLKSLSAQDEINNKYGEMTITRAEFLNCELKQRVGGFLNKEDLKIH